MKYRLLLIIAALPLLLAGTFWAKTTWDAGEFKRLDESLPANCEVLEGPASAEDMAADFKRGIVWISADDRRGGGPGKIFKLDFNDPSQTPVDATPSLPFDFHPHGIGLWAPDGSELALLLVVNHRETGEYIEFFEVTGGQLSHLKSISDPLLVSPNDVVPLDADRFYVTNDHRATEGLARQLEELLQLPRSNVVFFDGTSFQIAATGMAYANGLEFDHQRRQLLAAASVGRNIWVFRADDNGRLTLRFVIDADTGVDNLAIDEQGAVWIGAHPRLLTFSRYARGSIPYAPSEVLKLEFFLEDNYQLDRIFSHDGQTFSASASAIRTRDRLLVGSVLQPGVLVCPM